MSEGEDTVTPASTGEMALTTTGEASIPLDAGTDVPEPLLEPFGGESHYNRPLWEVDSECEVGAAHGVSGDQEGFVETRLELLEHDQDKLLRMIENSFQNLPGIVEEAV
ncbi:UNVERIFIED_CONTAM: hypothetical protein K2H54_025631 [Gekko kuhli]